MKTSQTPYSYLPNKRAGWKISQNQIIVSGRKMLKILTIVQARKGSKLYFMRIGFFFQKLIIVQGQIRSCRVEDGPKLNKASIHVYLTGKISDRSKRATIELKIKLKHFNHFNSFLAFPISRIEKKDQSQMMAHKTQSYCYYY